MRTDTEFLSGGLEVNSVLNHVTRKIEETVWLCSDTIFCAINHERWERGRVLLGGRQDGHTTRRVNVYFIPEEYRLF